MFKKGVTVDGVWLRTVGSQAQVLIQIDGQWRLVIGETIFTTDGKIAPVSHIVEPSGVMASPADEVTA